MDTVSAYSALEIEKSLLTIKPQDFIEGASRRSITIYYRFQKMSRENRVAIAAISFFFITLSTPLSSLLHKTCSAPATNCHSQGKL